MTVVTTFGGVGGVFEFVEVSAPGVDFDEDIYEVNMGK